MKPAVDAYTTALTLLSRRELSVSQLRERLVRRQLDTTDIDRAIDRLVADRTLDDRRVARAFARLEASVKGRGRRRVLQAMRRLGVSAEVAEGAVAEVFGEVDERALLERALDKTLRGRRVQDLDDKGRARVVRRLVAQGFAPSDVIRVLRG